MIFNTLHFSDFKINAVYNIAVTHQSTSGVIYISMIGIQYSLSNNGFICCIEQRINSIKIESTISESDNCFVASKQSQMTLIGTYTTPLIIQCTDYITPAYLVINTTCFHYLNLLYKKE